LLGSNGCEVYREREREHMSWELPQTSLTLVCKHPNLFISNRDKEVRIHLDKE
jgi:hypothetical protein